MPKRKMTGRVESDKMDKTVVLRVERVLTDPLTGKVIRKSKTFKAHDPENSCKLGDIVEIEEHRPISKDKRWIVKQIVKRNKLAGVVEKEVTELKGGSER